MSTTIIYENEYNKAITEQQAQIADSYVKVIKINNLIKVKEDYENN